MMNKRKTLVALLLAAVMLFSFASVSMAATNDDPGYIRTYLEDDEIPFDVHPFLTGGTVYAGFRGIFEALGYTVKYDSATRIVTGQSPSTSIVINLITNEMTINGGKFTKQPPEPPKPILIRGRTLVPIRFIAEASGLNVEWIPSSRIVKLTYMKPAASDLDAILSLLVRNKKAAVEGKLDDLLATFDAKSPLRSDYSGLTAIAFPGSESTFENIAIDSWQGNKATISYKVTTKATGSGFFLDRVDMMEADLTRTAVGGWRIYDFRTKSTAYSKDASGLAEAVVPDADKTAILAVINANETALNAEKVADLAATYGGDASFKKQLTDTTTAFFKSYDIKFTNEVKRIVYYQAGTAYVYVVQTSEKKSASDYVNKRVTMLLQVNQDKNGNWTINPVSQTIASEKL